MKQLFRILIFSFYISSSAQQIRNLYPSSVVDLNLSMEGEKKFKDNEAAYQLISEKLSKGAKLENLAQQEREIYQNIDETQEDYWDIIGSGCSWYCGGGPKEVTASSSLASQGDNSYFAKNAHDLSYKTAWVEGSKGNGIGEYLLYHFSAGSPRINEIIIINGYIKSAAAWQNNSRVKKLKMYVNNRPYALLNLEDKRASQHFKIEPIGFADRDWKSLPDWTIKFEIVEIYKGIKFDDVAITEIYFDGLDVHCFIKGTLVTLHDGTTKKIEDITTFDKVLTFNRNTSLTQTSNVDKIEKAVHHNLVKYIFDNGQTITTTQDHPFLLKEKNWASLLPDQSGQYRNFRQINTIAIDDNFLFHQANGELTTFKLKQIEHISGHFETYTISKLSLGDNFYANGFIVGVEELEKQLDIGSEFVSIKTK